LHEKATAVMYDVPLKGSADGFMRSIAQRSGDYETVKLEKNVDK